MHIVEAGTKVIILAGGRGKRMGDHTVDRQKCVLPIDNEPVLSHVITHLTEAFGALNLLLAVAYRAGDVKDVVEKRTGRSIKATYIPHTVGAESGGALASMEHLMKPGETILSIPGDVIVTPRTYQKSVERHDASNTEITVVPSVYVDEVDTHALVKVHPHTQLVQEFNFPVNKSNDSTGYFRDMGIEVFRKPFMDVMRSISPDLFGIAVSVFTRELAKQERAGAYVSPDPWLHVGYPEDLEKSWKNQKVAA